MNAKNWKSVFFEDGGLIFLFIIVILCAIFIFWMLTGDGGLWAEEGWVAQTGVQEIRSPGK